MSFLRIEALFALPLVLLPILIHLIHRRKHPTVPWAAMMFLQRATQSQRGGAKIKRWLVLAVRTMVVAAILFALSRPLSSGVFGLAASRVANESATMVIVDRSPSMQRRVSSDETRLQTGLSAVQQTLSTLGTNKIVLVDSVVQQPIEFDSVASLADSFAVGAADSSADVPAMILSALESLRTLDQRTADLWICSDRSANDWKINSDQWSEIGRIKAELGEGVRFHLVGFSSDNRVNHSIHIDRVGWSALNGGELVLDAVITRDDGGIGSVTVQVMLDNLSYSSDVTIKDGLALANEIRIPVAEDTVQALSDGGTLYGRVTLPADVNTADNDCYFSVGRQSDRPIGLVTESECIALQSITQVLGRAVNPASNDGSGSITGEAELIGGDAFLNTIACLVWQGTLPNDRDAAAIDRFLQRGGSVVFFPAKSGPATNEFLGVRWTQWRKSNRFDVKLDEWEFAVGSFCTLEGNLVQVASVSEEGSREESVFIGQKRIGEGTAFFCGADVFNSSGEFVRNGLPLYALMQEAIDASDLFRTPELGWTAGPETHNALLRGELETMRVEVLLPAGTLQNNSIQESELGHHAGVYRFSSELSEWNDDNNRLVVINRPKVESGNDVIEMDQLDKVVPEIEWNRVQVDASSASSGRGLVHELWAVVWILVIVGMVVESWLTLPPRISGGQR